MNELDYNTYLIDLYNLDYSAGYAPAFFAADIDAELDLYYVGGEA